VTVVATAAATTVATMRDIAMVFMTLSFGIPARVLGGVVPELARWLLA
jgi:hypothetical protein